MYKVCTHADMQGRKKTKPRVFSTGVKASRSHIDSSFPARVTRFVLSEARIDVLNCPVTTSPHADASFLPPVMFVRTARRTVHVWRHGTAHVANDYQNLSRASGYNVHFSNQGAARRPSQSCCCPMLCDCWQLGEPCQVAGWEM